MSVIQGTDDHKGMHILAVDDDPGSLLLVEQTLQQEGYRVATASNGVEALERIGAQVPDLVLLDLVMPELDGFAVCERIRSSPRTAYVPVVAITSMEDAESINRVFALGASGFVTKPVNWTLLSHQVAFYLEAGRTLSRLRERERQLREAQTYAHLGHWSLHTGTSDTEWSDEIYRIIGLDPSVPAGPDTLKKVLHPDDAPAVMDSLARALEGACEHDLDYRIVRPDGEERWVTCKAWPVMNTDRQIDGIEGLLQDITERKRSEQKLRESEERFALAMRGSNDGVFDWDLQSNRVYYSERWKSMLGYGEHELENQFSTWERLLEPQDLKRSRAVLRDYLAGRCDDSTLEFRMRHKDGHWVDILARAYLVRDPKGSPIRMVGTHVDITERKQAQRQVEVERNRARQYLEVAGVTLVALDREGRVTLINPKGCELLGLPVQAILGRDWFENFLPKGNLAEVRGVFEQIMAGDLGPREYFDNSILTAQGSERLMAWHNGLLRDDAGRISGLLSSGEDVTERRRAEQSLHEERSFLQNVIDGIDDPILVLAPDHRVLRMNRKAQGGADQAGLDAGSLRCHQVFHRSDQPCTGLDHPCPLEQVLQTGRTCKVIHNHYTADGRQRTVEVAASPMIDEDGEVAGVIETSRDITEHLALLDELKERELSYAHLAQHDPLTGLPNRLLFADRLSQAIHGAHRNHGKLAVLFIDLDRFKQVNDSFDHSYGDEVLKAVATRLRSLFREDDTIARMGSDEFTVILGSLQQDQDAALVARKILDLIQKPFDVQGHGVFLGVSIGISLYPEHGSSVDDLVRNADTAMYRAKEEGGNSFQYYSRELTAKAFERVLLESSLHKAVEHGELVLHYQPQLDLASGTICGLEALVRWQHADMGLVSPARFIPLAEETGIILPMGDWILREACRQMQQWREKLIVPNDALISVNLSVKQFDQPDMAARISRILQETGLDPEALELEITESTMMHAPEATAHTLRDLRTLGVKVAIDDFGTGYSSLNYLKRLPLTKLKIDQSFVFDIPNDPNDVAIARAVIALGRSLSLRVLAEGVETREQQAFLTREGCHSGQGYLFARPLPAAEYEAFIEGGGVSVQHAG